MKKNEWYLRYMLKIWRSKTLLVMKQFIVMMLIFNLSAFSSSLGQEIKDFKVENANLKECIHKIEKITGIGFLYKGYELKNVKGISIDVKNTSVDELLDKVLENTGFIYEINQGIILIKKKLLIRPEKEIIKGKVSDEKGNPLPGVSVIIKGTTIGTSTDVNGDFKIEMTEVTKTTALVFSFMGMETKEIILSGRKLLEVILQEDKKELDEVVVTGYSKISKESFTGNVVSVKKEDLLKVSKTNIISALQTFDPSFRIQENNQWGSDPNAMPEMYVRGRSGIGVKDLDRDALSKSSLKDNPNLPIFLMDGFEVSVEKVYDFDPTRIESITILKDAASTAIYGSRAANGVIIITTVKPKAGKLNVTYNMTGSVTTPDLTDYNLMNAKELLDTEIAAGFYDKEEYYDQLNAFEELNNKLYNIKEGVDTYWLSKPLRSVLNTKHSLFVEGGSENIRFGVNMNYNNEDGVMKESFRNRMGAGFYIDYRSNKLQIRNSISYNITNSQESPYGNFSDYANALPYDKYKDESGNYLRLLESWHSSTGRENPLYESGLYNYSKSNYEELINNTNLNYYINDYLQIKGQFSIAKKTSLSERFLDPLSAKNPVRLKASNLSSGTLRLNDGNSMRWNTNILMSYNRTISNHNINLTFGLNALSNTSETVYSEYRGFPSGKLNSINYAEEIYEKPTKDEKTSRLFGLLSCLNYTYNNIYLLDLSYRLDGSSEFGTSKKHAPFWSGGFGINIHNYEFFDNNEVVDRLKIRASYGSSGKVNFPAYVAQTTYDILSEEWYRTGFGSSLKAMGNKNLTWEKTKTLDYGFEIALFKSALFIKASHYDKTTVDLINTVTIPSSAGFIQYYDNMGEVKNTGYEITVRGDIIRTKDINFAIYANLAHNKNKIMAISESLKSYNDRVNQFYKETSRFKEESSRPITKYEEGNSLTAIYGMKSLGIDPTTGQEIFLRRDGEITKIWDASEQVVIGDREPKAQGSFGFNFRYKNFSLYSSFMFQFGGQAYNSTLVSKVENARIYEANVDKRVFSDRWKQAGDIAKYKSIKDNTGYTKPSSRFVQDYNVVSLNSLTAGYDFDKELLKKAHIGMLRLEIGSNNLFRLSSVKQERGTSYPYARTINFSLKASF